jgi:hypothetical protein
MIIVINHVPKVFRFGNPIGAKSADLVKINRAIFLFETIMIDNLQKGTWLVVVEDGSTSAVQIKPDFAEIDAALHYVNYP